MVTYLKGSGDNLYVVKNGEIITPPTLNNLRGITRMVLLDLAKSLGITVKEQNIGYFDLYSADEMICYRYRCRSCPDHLGGRADNRERASPGRLPGN